MIKNGEEGDRRNCPYGINNFSLPHLKPKIPGQKRFNFPFFVFYVEPALRQECLPAKGELPALNVDHEKHKNRIFYIISI